MRINFIIIRRGSKPIFMMRDHQAEKQIEYIDTEHQKERGILEKAYKITERVDRELGKR